MERTTINTKTCSNNNKHNFILENHNEIEGIGAIEYYKYLGYMQSTGMGHTQIKESPKESTPTE